MLDEEALITGDHRRIRFSEVNAHTSLDRAAWL
jgi:hypothetical protein